MGYFCSNPHPFYHQMLASENEGGRKYQKNTTFPYFVCVHTPTCVLYLHETASSFQKYIFFCYNNNVFSVKHFVKITFVHLSLTLDFLSFQNKLCDERQCIK